MQQARPGSPASPENATDGKGTRLHWAVYTNYRLRTASFAFSFVIIGTHMWGKGYGEIAWVMLVLQFLIYPHLMFLRARHATDSQQAEINNLFVDTLLMAMWTSFLQFPLMIALMLWNATSINLTFTRGLIGIPIALSAVATGILISFFFLGIHFSPETGSLVNLLCWVGLSCYLLAIGNGAHTRNLQLRKTRERLRMGEQTLHIANETLKRQLDEIQKLQAELNEQAIRDPLTGLYNRRYLETIFARELARCNREGQQLTLMMIDVDYFKGINDTYGHQGGDEVLKKLAALLLESIRPTDVACRFGGEEFLVLLPDMTLDTGIARANEWRAAFAATTIPFEGAGIQATMSIGIATYPEHGGSANELIGRADVALYRAKTGGRNRVVSFE